MLLVLRMIAQLVGVMRISFQLQRMELLVFCAIVPCFKEASGFSRCPSFQAKTEFCSVQWSVLVECRGGGSCCSGAHFEKLWFSSLVPLQLSFQFFEHCGTGKRVVVIRFIYVCFVLGVKLECWKEGVYLVLDDQRRAGGRKR